MDQRVQQVLDEYERRAAQESRLHQTLAPEEFAARIDEFLIAVGPQTGTVLNLLAKGAQARTLLELGTSYGYSTVYLAEAARETGGRVISLELSAAKVDYARQALTRAGLESFVDFRVGSALDLLPALPGPFDLVLIDLWKDLYVPCLELVRPKLSAGALIAADNMIQPEAARVHAAAYRRRVRELGFDSVLLPVGSGVELSRTPGG